MERWGFHGVSSKGEKMGDMAFPLFSQRSREEGSKVALMLGGRLASEATARGLLVLLFFLVCQLL